MSTFDDSLNEDLSPPTDIDVKWARENFSSRVLPPLDGSEEPGSPGFSVVVDPVENQVLEHGLVAPGNTHITVGSMLLASKYGVYRIVVGSTNFSEKQIRNFSSTTPTVDTGEGIIEFLSCTVTQETDSGVMQKCTVAYQYTLKATIKNDTVVPTGLDSVEDGAYFDRTQVKLYDYKFNQASGLIVVKIVDDVPTAVDEATVWVTEDGESVVSGDVTLNDLAGADTPLVFVQWDPANAAVIAQLNVYGVLVLNNDGTWMYTLDNTRPATQALTKDDHLTFPLQYQIRDNDGDLDTGTMTIGINGSMDESPLICTLPTTGSYTGKPGTLTAHMSAMTVNLDPADCTIVDAMNWTHRATPLSWGSARPARMFPLALSGLASEGQGGFIVMTQPIVPSPHYSIYMEFDTPSMAVYGTPSSLFCTVYFNVEPGTPLNIHLDYGTVYSDAFSIPSGEVTHSCWSRLGAMTFVYNSGENYYDSERDDWFQIYHMTVNVEYSYDCFAADGTLLKHVAGSTAVMFDYTYNVGSSNVLAPALSYDNSGLANRRVSNLEVDFTRHSCDILGVSPEPLPTVLPRLTQWPLQIGASGDGECFADYFSADGTTMWLSEAITPPPSGNAGTMAVGHRLAIKNVGSLVTLRFYPNRQDVVDGLVPAIADQKQLLLCHSSQPFTGTGGTSGTDPHPPQLISNPIPSDVALLKTTPVVEGDIQLHGSSYAAHLPMEITAANWGSGAVSGGDGTVYPYLRLTFQRIA